MKQVIMVLLMLTVLGNSVLAGPVDDKTRRAAAEKTLRLLSDTLKSRGFSYPSGNNGLCVVYSLAGLAFSASGTTLKDGTYKKSLKKVYEYLKDNVELEDVKDPKWDQRSWRYGHTLMCLSEIYLGADSKQKAKIMKLMQSCCDRLIAYQSPAGGWCHGDHKSGPNPLKYTHFVAVSNIAMIGLGAARRVGCKVDQEVFTKGIKYIEDSSSGGQVGYSPRKGQKGFGCPGRNAGAYLCCLASGKKHKIMSAAKKNYEREIGKTEKDHGSAQLSQMIAAFASYNLGDSGWKKFWEELSETIIKRQKKDGSFGVPPGDTPGKGNSNFELGDRANATHAIMLLLPEKNLKALNFSLNISSTFYQKIAIMGHSDGSVKVKLMDFDDRKAELAFTKSMKEQVAEKIKEIKEQYAKDIAEKKTPAAVKKPYFKLLFKAYKSKDSAKLDKDLAKAIKNYAREKGGKKPS